MDKFEFLKEWFYKEDERKDCLNNSLNIPIGILTAILAAIYFLFNTFNFTPECNIVKYLFLISAITCIVFWIISIYFLIKSYNDFYKGYIYKGFPNGNFLTKEENDLKEYVETYRDVLDPNITVELLLKQNVEKILVECLEVNLFNNDRKSAYLHSSKIYVLNCILALFVASICFTINYINHKKDEIHQVEIINFKDMSNERKPPPPPPPRQEPRIIKESEQPRRPNPTPPKPRT